ncbi:ion transporter [Mucilaginibacter sp. Bleaf8]|uniref:ion channel n=1 Tax=Mucilaginibacter sp. Bleaf8 TaxID=2834430 RepID=UPI001BCD1CFA|nr:ion channel [Mucilaginibacter sp. Bleaf8]MBS7562876.1 ion transporter [Mucilaginibacter sp. Bleaf8]
MAIEKTAINPEDDLGFGNQAISQRIVNRDGTINVKRKGLPALNTFDNYNTLITMSWPKFWLMVIGAYLITNILFATIYLLLGINNLNGADGNTPLHHFFDAFFFSAQTLSTVGYGHISPKGIATNFVAAFESMIGLLAFALATGLLYGRFSRPSAKISYSDQMLVAPYLGTGRGLMFRMANKRRNILIDVDVEVIFSYNEMVDGKPVRKFFPLELERSKVSMLTLSWTVVHPLNNNSPIKNITLEELRATNAIFTILIKAYDDAFAQTVHSRTSYQYDEVIWGAKFTPAFYHDQDGKVVLDINKISDHIPAELPIG